MSTPYSPGLEGVTAGISSISEVDPERNELIYRGYNIHDLVKCCSFDEVAYLLLLGKLPTRAELSDFLAQVGAERSLPDSIYDLYRMFPRDAHPMDTLKAAVAVLAMFDPEAGDSSRQANVNKAIRLYAKIPNLVVNGFRISQGLDPVPPDPTPTHEASFFQM